MNDDFLFGLGLGFILGALVCGFIVHAVVM